MLVATLEAIFKPEGIAFLTELESSYKKKFALERHHLIGVCKCLLKLVAKNLVVAPEHLTYGSGKREHKNPTLFF